MTITIQLDEPSLAALTKEAAGLGMSVEQLADTIIHQHIRARTAPELSVDDTAFRAAMAATFRENEELYRRLAK